MEVEQGEQRSLFNKLSKDIINSRNQTMSDYPINIYIYTIQTQFAPWLTIPVD